MHLAAVELHAARLLDGIGDVLRGDRPEEPAIVARGLRDGEHRAREQRGVLLSALRHLTLGPLLRLHAPLGLGDRPGGGRLGQLARQQEVAQVARRDVDDVAARADVLHVLEEYRLSHPYAYLSDT